MNDRVIDYILENLEEGPEFFYDEECSFIRWAYVEILGLILDHPTTPAEEIVEEFEFKCRMFTEMAALAKQRLIFGIAAATAADLMEKI